MQLNALLRLAVIGMVASTGTARAAAPVLNETRTMEIAASPAKVWSVVQQFSDMTWVPPVKSSTATQGNTVGSIRGWWRS